MERYIYSKLTDWIKMNRRKPLLLRGARQVGKTWLIEKLAKENFEFFLKVDFEENPEYSALFEKNLDPQKICSELEIRTGINIKPGKTILFFDEIQACPRAIMALRYFYEKLNELHVVAAGSLLEFAFSEISFPVGRIQSIEVHPMNFSEFLLALNLTKAADLCNNRITGVSDATHEFLLEQLRIYWLVGGMPECVKVYNDTKSLKLTSEVQDEISQTYRLDFNKYKPKTDVNCLNAVFSNVAANVGKQIKYTGLAVDFTIPTIKKAYESLLQARIAKKVRALTNIGLPMEVYASDKKFKNLFLDIGLMNRVMGIDYNEALSHKNLLGIYRGQLAEQFVGQEFSIQTNNQLYYWARDAKNSSAEVDYLMMINGTIYPVEVKDGPTGKLRSLHIYRNTYMPSWSVVFHSGNATVLKDDKIVFLPLYFAGNFARFGIDNNTELLVK